MKKFLLTLACCVMAVVTLAVSQSIALAAGGMLVFMKIPSYYMYNSFCNPVCFTYICRYKIRYYQTVQTGFTGNRNKKIQSPSGMVHNRNYTSADSNGSFSLYERKLVCTSGR